MSTKKTPKNAVTTNTSAITGNNGHDARPGYLGRLKLLHRDHELLPPHLREDVERQIAGNRAPRREDMS